MDAATLNVVTEIMTNILLGCFSLAILAWGVVGIVSLINEDRREKREKEYHEKRMKELSK
jgi:hypothetical protein